jgi:hypothetical protein
MSLIFNSIVQFEIQPERTKRRVKRDDLDTLMEVWTGPSDQEDIFVPTIGTVHPQFNLMTVIDTSVKRMPASVSEVTIDYHGKLDSSGQSQYTSVPNINQYWSEGEVSYQINSSVSLTIQGSAPGLYSTIIQVGVMTYSHRYTGRCCEIVYLTNRRPTGNPTNLGLSNEFLGFTNEWDLLSGFQPGAKITGGGQPIKKLTCTDVKIEDRADGWYRVTETYQSRQFAQATIAAPSSGSIAVKPTQPGTAAVINAGGSSGGSTAGSATNTFQHYYGQQPTVSDPNTQPNQYDTAQATGMDPTTVAAANNLGTPVAPLVISQSSVAANLASGTSVDSLALDY